MEADAIDRNNQYLLHRLQKIHARPDTGWNKSHLFESLSPQFKRQKAQVRSGQRAELANKNYHDNRRLRDVTAHVKFGSSKHSLQSSLKLPQRPSGLRKARRMKTSAQRKLVKSAGPESGMSEKAESTIPLDRKHINSKIWKLVFRSGARLDMLSPNEEERLEKRSQLSIVSMWRLRSSKGCKQQPANKLLIICTDVKTLSKKSLLLRAHHIRYMMTMKDPNQKIDDETAKKNSSNQNATTSKRRGGRQLDSRGWDHAVQIPQSASGSFDALHYHLGQFVEKPPEQGPVHPIGNKRLDDKWYRVVLNSLVVSADLTLAVQHPLASFLSRQNVNRAMLKDLIRGDVKQIVMDDKNTVKDPRDRVDENCTFSPKLIGRPLRKKRNEYEAKAAFALAQSRRKVLGHGYENEHGKKIKISAASSQKKLDIKRRKRIVQQVQIEAALRNEVAITAIEELHGGASKIQSVFRRRQAGMFLSKIRSIIVVDCVVYIVVVFWLLLPISQNLFFGIVSDLFPTMFPICIQQCTMYNILFIKTYIHITHEYPAREVQTKREQEQSAIKMQAVIRGRAKRKERKEKSAAAAKLQARFRGKQARIKVQDVSEEKYANWRRTDALQSLFRLKDRDMDGLLTVQDLGTMLKEITRKHRSATKSTKQKPRRTEPKSKDLRKLIRAMNLTNPNERDINPDDGSSSGGVSEETFVQYMLQGLQMARTDIVAFRRKGDIQSMLADLIGSMSKEVEQRILSERSAALNAVFNHFDEDNSGEIDTSEFVGLISYFSGKGKEFAPTAAEITDLMNALDQGGDGMLQREEFIAFSMGGLSRSAKERREYAKQSPMHNKLCVLLDRIALGIDRRTKGLHSKFESLVKTSKARTMDMRCLYQAFLVSKVEGADPDKETIKNMKIAAKRFTQAVTGATNGALSKNDFVLFLLSGGSDPTVLRAQHPIVDKWRTSVLKSMPW
jgi:Ca2+-binding EF-hand superfamily protein